MLLILFTNNTNAEIATAMTIIHGEKGPAYHQCADDESDPLAPNDNEPPYNVQQSRSRYSKFAVYGFAALTILEFFYIIWILHPTNLGTMKSGFVTDFQDAKRSISLIQRRFTNQLRLDKNGSLYMATNPNEIQYTGTPSEGIDKAWGNLLGHRYFHLREDEVQKLRKDNELEAPSPLTKVEGSGRLTGIYAGIDMLHSLHCLNDIRKTLYPEYYTEHELPEEWRQMHYGMFISLD